MRRIVSAAQDPAIIDQSPTWRLLAEEPATDDGRTVVVGRWNPLGLMPTWQQAFALSVNGALILVGGSWEPTHWRPCPPPPPYREPHD